MTNQIKAYLSWVVPLRSGGSAPRGGRIIVPAKFDHQGDDWIKNAWSLVVESKNKPDEQGGQEVSVHFLADNAPVEWLVRGRKFTLYEGALRLAEGEIL